MQQDPKAASARETAAKSGQDVRTVELRPESPLAQGRYVVPRPLVAAFGLGVILLAVAFLLWRARRGKRAQG